ncbi:MAG: hypothetical protein KDC98_06880 [Planctomycetes bacterium]|nr:hypothetical protein [Planctomycetota bacterium]
MKLLVRCFAASLLALCFAMPGVGGEGGENAGGTGVWILPRSQQLGCSSPAMGQSFSAEDFENDLTLVVSEECGHVIATATEPSNGEAIALPVSGREVTIRRSILQAYSAASVPVVQVLIADQAQQGYLITLAIDSANRTCTLTVQ